MPRKTFRVTAFACFQKISFIQWPPSPSYLPPNNYEVPPSKSYIPPLPSPEIPLGEPTNLNPVELEELPLYHPKAHGHDPSIVHVVHQFQATQPSTDLFHNAVKEKIKSLHGDKPSVGPFHEHVYQKNSPTYDVPANHVKDVHIVRPHHYTSEHNVAHPEPHEISQLTPRLLSVGPPHSNHHLLEDDHQQKPLRFPTHHQSQPIHHDHEIPLDNNAHYSNREALQEQLKTYRPDNRVLKVTEAPKLERLVKPSETEVEENATEATNEGLETTTSEETSTSVVTTKSEVISSTESITSSPQTTLTTTTTTSSTTTTDSTTSPVSITSTSEPTLPTDLNRFALGGNSNDNFVFGPQNKPEEPTSNTSPIQKEQVTVNPLKARQNKKDKNDALFRYIHIQTSFH